MATKVKVKKKTASTGNGLQDIIVRAIDDKKGEEITILDLRKLHESVTDFFIICHVATTVQVRAIAHNIIDEVQIQTGERPFHKEGFNNLEWVLIDYVNIVVHIFIKEKRAFYQLEDLWDDATKTTIE